MYNGCVSVCVSPKISKIIIIIIIICLFVWILLHINCCMSFNAKSSLYIYTKYMISKHIFWITSLNEFELIFSYTVL